MTIFLPIIHVTLAIVLNVTGYSIFEDGSGTVTTERGVSIVCIAEMGCTPDTEDVTGDLHEDGSVSLVWSDGATASFCLFPEDGCFPTTSGINSDQ